MEEYSGGVKKAWVNKVNGGGKGPGGTPEGPGERPTSKKPTPLLGFGAKKIKTGPLT